jgi:REP element-mobilizing transposase RayT
MEMNSSPRPTRRTSDLRIGRQSLPGATYFLTLCEARRQLGFTDPPLVSDLKEALEALHLVNDFSLIAASVMPDHLHLLGVLGARLSLSRAIGKLKAQTRAHLRARGLQWQENFYEHRLRGDDELEPFARYIFLNPYRAALLPLNATWPHWLRRGDIRFQFEEIVDRAHAVPAAWLGEPDPAGASDL